MSVGRVINPRDGALADAAWASKKSCALWSWSISRDA